uniref:NADH dehydrogenase subunit 6 n=1 Tax=Carios vespertilionis TaxID=870211 RepID=A0A8B0R8I9_9ACAR|nr:NADH dehydrogenase subunit 6 [Carios vespertilionis]UNO54362.1 NADH dehydrogenase subunit 6 [Carios vespertilionis]UNO54375.1 NADH dehydrogenase subunit 6 [Carios vespertilionis]
MKMIFLISILFMTSTQPIMMILILILITLNISLLIYLQMKMTWFPMLIIILMLGGMMILFLYVTSLTPNKKFIWSNKFFPLIMLTPFLPTIKPNFNSNNFYTISNLLNNSNTLMLTFIMLYLLITLLTITKLIHSSFAPLKSY